MVIVVFYPLIVITGSCWCCKSRMEQLPIVLRKLIKLAKSQGDLDTTGDLYALQCIQKQQLESFVKIIKLYRVFKIAAG